MVLYFTAIDKDQQRLESIVPVDQEEIAFELLNSVRSQGNTIQEAYLLEKDSCIRLPVQVFDGESFLNPVQELQKQWQAVLERAVQPSMSKPNKMIDWTRQRIDRYEATIASLERAIGITKELLQRTQCSGLNSAITSALLHHYEFCIERWQESLSQALAGRQLAQIRLNQLMKI